MEQHLPKDSNSKLQPSPNTGWIVAVQLHIMALKNAKDDGKSGKNVGNGFLLPETNWLTSCEIA